MSEQPQPQPSTYAASTTPTPTQPYFDISYIKTLPGILKVTEVVSILVILYLLIKNFGIGRQ